MTTYKGEGFSFKQFEGYKFRAIVFFKNGGKTVTKQIYCTDRDVLEMFLESVIKKGTTYTILQVNTKEQDDALSELIDSLDEVLTPLEKAKEALEQKDIYCVIENLTLYVCIGDTKLELSDYEIKYQASEYDNMQE
jgi:allophanate hydrolase subunit 1